MRLQKICNKSCFQIQKGHPFCNVLWIDSASQWTNWGHVFCIAQVNGKSMKQVVFLWSSKTPLKSFPLSEGTSVTWHIKGCAVTAIWLIKSPSRSRHMKLALNKLWKLIYLKLARLYVRFSLWLWSLFHKLSSILKLSNLCSRLSLKERFIYRDCILHWQFQIAICKSLCNIHFLSNKNIDTMILIIRGQV